MLTKNSKSVRVRIAGLVLVFVMILNSAMPVSVSAMPYSIVGTPGTLDATFSMDGKLTTNFSGNTDMARSIVIQPDGKIIVM